MFPDLAPASWSLDDLALLAKAVMAEEETEPTPEGEVDEEENNDIDAGVTYIGQFIDHDLTLDDRKDDLVTPTDPSTLRNARTPAFDLDSVYGAGPDGSPELYEADGVRLRLGAPLTGSPDIGARDLPRENGQALLGDGRDDENRIVAGVHSVFLRFHTMMVAEVQAEHANWSASRVFEEARRLVQLHYQWAILTDFLPTMVGSEIVDSILPLFPTGNRKADLRYYDACDTGVPVEFAVAAYRVGHSMVRPLYRINEEVRDRLPVFANSTDVTDSLVGFSPSPENFGIDWNFLFHLEGERRVGRPQTAYKFDNSLVFPLGLLPLPETGAGPASLALRNLMRSVQLGLPSGQDVARAMDLEPLRDDQVLVGKATGEPDDAQALTDISESFAGKAPLWTYILAEATAQSWDVSDGRIQGEQLRPNRLGPVGGRIVAETFIGLMAADPNSVLHTRNFRPSDTLAIDGRFGFPDLIRRLTAA